MTPPINNFVKNVIIVVLFVAVIFISAQSFHGKKDILTKQRGLQNLLAPAEKGVSSHFHIFFLQSGYISKTWGVGAPYCESKKYLSLVSNSVFHHMKDRANYVFHGMKEAFLP